MRFSTLLTSFMATSAIATPVIVTETRVVQNIVTVYNTVYAGKGQAPAPSPPAPAPAPPAHHSHGHKSVITVIKQNQPQAPPSPAPPAPPAPAPPAPVATTLKAVAAPSPPAPAPAAKVAAANNNVDSFQSTCINVHNKNRALHKAGPLAWNNTLAEFAQNYLDNQNCAFAHSGGPYGENIALGYPSTEDAITAWYDENVNYNYASGLFSEDTGHFTQLVWLGSTQLGCAQYACSGRTFFACEYYPRGNIIGYFTENVLD